MMGRGGWRGRICPALKGRGVEARVVGLDVAPAKGVAGGDVRGW